MIKITTQEHRKPISENLPTQDSPVIPVAEIDRINEKFKNASPQEILMWACGFLAPDLASSSSFQSQSIPLLHLISITVPELPILFLDTGFHFPETLLFRDQLVKTFNLNIINIVPSVSKAELFSRMGDTPYRRDPDLCCYINKVEPMQRATANLKGIIAGVRRDQTKQREELEVLEIQENGSLKIHPLLNWTKNDIQKYIEYYKLPRHPLYSKGYKSVGCAPCTRPVIDGEDERAGRWAGIQKTECGLHFNTSNQNK